jgi:hypothetical protein
LLLLLFSGTGFAQASAPVQLAWRAPANCPQEPKMSQKIRALLGPQRAHAPQSRLRAEGSVEPTQERFRLTLNIHYDAVNGTRVVEADSCEDLAGAAAVTLALLMQVEKRSGAPLTAGDLGGPSAARRADLDLTVPVSKSPSSDHESHAAREGADAELASARWHFALRAPMVRAPMVRADIGALPGPSYGLGVAAGARYRN